MNTDVIKSICSTIADYREGEIAPRTPHDVDTWVRQFPKPVREPLLIELDHILSRTYISKKSAKKFLAGLVTNDKLAGSDPNRFWHGCTLLDIQQGGRSQKDLLALFDSRLKKILGVGRAHCKGSSTNYIYLDDCIFSGKRVLHDLGAWLENNAPSKADVHVVVMALHQGGQYYASTQLGKKAKELGKAVTFHWWRILEIEDRRYYMATSDVLRPTAIPDDEPVKRYVKQLEDAGYPPVLRTGSSVGGNKFFSSHDGRRLVEEQLLIAGANVKEKCVYLPEAVRPLGFNGLKMLGFGSLTVTYRNCPNNCPPALWAGDPWVPLLPRRVNERPVTEFDDIEF